MLGMATKSYDITVDVTAAVGYGQPTQVTATVHVPDLASTPDRPVVCFALPGGGYSRRYFSMDLPDAATGGQAAWHTDRGWIFVALDHLGFGDSSCFEPDLLTFEHVADANNALVTHVIDGLAAGTLIEGLPAVTNAYKVGIGQSMGGCFLVVQQAHHRSFDAVAVLGYSAIHTVVPSRPGVPNMVMPWMTRVGYPIAPRILNPDALAAAAAQISNPDELAAAVADGEHLWTWAFHHDSEPRDIVNEDMAAMSGGPVPSWRSATSAACGILMVAPGAVAVEAAAITVPVIIVAGEVDVVPDPWAESRAYISSTDITTAVFPLMAHMHNFASTREHLWSRLHDWATSRAAG
jgi:alpha-beta hydrolase superfamily lysophospholipase